MLIQPSTETTAMCSPGTLPPTRSGQDVDGAGSVDIDVHGLHDDTVESKQQGTTSLGQARAFASGCVKNTQLTRARALNQSPTRSESVTPDPYQLGRARKAATA